MRGFAAPLILPKAELINVTFGSLKFTWLNRLKKFPTLDQLLSVIKNVVSESLTGARRCRRHHPPRSRQPSSVDHRIEAFEKELGTWESRDKYFLVSGRFLRGIDH